MKWYWIVLIAVASLAAGYLVAQSYRTPESGLNIRESIKNRFKTYGGEDWRDKWHDWKRGGGIGPVPAIGGHWVDPITGSITVKQPTKT